MTKIKAILHIGAGKCGSSALQTMLTNTPLLMSRNQECYQYVAINHRGIPVFGDHLKKHAQVSEFGYHACIPAHVLVNNDSYLSGVLKEDIHKIAENRSTLIFSNEGWIEESPIFKVNSILDNLNLECQVLMYIRSPVEWINSAWWQWGAWSGIDFKSWLLSSIESVKWNSYVKQWKSTSGVDSVCVRALSSDIIADFFDYINVHRSELCTTTNRSLPASILRLYQSCPELRSSPHLSASIDFVLGRRLKNMKGSAPWVLSNDDIEFIINETYLSNNELIAHLPSEQKEVFLNDPRYWDADFYLDRKQESPGKIDVQIKDMLEISSDALTSLCELDAECRKLKSLLIKNGITVNDL